MNGDRYPDIVGNMLIQYTSPRGSLSTKKLSVSNILVSEGSSIATGKTWGIKTLRAIPKKSTGAVKSILDNFDGPYGLGNTAGDSDIDIIYMDINGDGLPDRITSTNFNSIGLNLGYSFTGSENWMSHELSISHSEAQSKSIPLTNFNIGISSWSAGLACSENSSYETQSFIDINNDGLVDIVTVNAIGGQNFLNAFINNGNGFNQVCLGIIDKPQINSNIANNYGINGSVTAGVPLSPFAKLCGSVYADYSKNVSIDKYRFLDLNGDGFLDFVIVDGDYVKAKMGKPKKVNILKKVQTPVNSSYTFDYIRSTPTEQDPNSRWLFSSAKIFDGFAGDGGQDTLYFKYTYEDSKYHRMERDNFGYRVVKTKQYDNFDPSGVCYRTTEEEYHNDHYLFKGLKNRELVNKGSNIPFVETLYTWDRKEISTGKIIPADSAHCFGPYYPALSFEDKDFYEDQSTYQMHTRKSYKHGRFGNVTEYTNYSNIQYNNDNLKAVITYSYDLTNHFTAMVDEIKVYDFNNNLLQERQATYTPHGRIEEIKANSGNGTYQYTNLQYDQYGNIFRILYPENVNGERLSFEYNYDNLVHSYPIRIIDYWDNITETNYNLKLGKPERITDYTGNEMRYTYYADGKPQTVLGPKEIQSNVPFTILFEYWDELGGATSASDKWAMTTHYDPLIQGNQFITLTLSDGLGRVVQTKKTATINGLDSVMVSGKIIFDEFGRQIQVGQPITEAIGSLVGYNSAGIVNPSTTTYDTFDRPTLQTFPDGTSIEYVYSIENDAYGIKCFKTQITDQNGKITSQFKDPRGLQTSVTAPYSTITKFQYSPLGQLISSVDPENNETTYQYDMLGRLISRNHPDAGTTSYTYDMAGNILTTQTANLNAVSEFISYIYEDCRLAKI